MTIRRACEIAIAMAALCVAAPLAVVTMLLVWLNFGRPIFFRQVRSGLAGRPFTVWKFRSMPDRRDADGVSLPDAARLTRFGRMLRRSRMDELPQLLSVLAGDMAIVGPRPLLPETIAAAGRTGVERGKVRPGLTGWAQVSGNTLLTEHEKIMLDLWYIDHRSAASDLVVVLRTLAIPFLGERRDVVALRRASCGP
ncbi:MAG TPA: sugar transferase [Sphingomonas sp.]|jgi:lipopolysaccharide/colanic/teichoic acid biosynthesis glycosyltransferase|nr:sugar transferase [Sphingomonas sp.]